MKRMSVKIAALVVLATPMVFAEGYDNRQERQENRIEQGVQSGELTAGEANRLERQQNRIERMENRAEADGVVTRGEKARIHKAQNRAHRDIRRMKHNGRSK